MSKTLHQAFALDAKDNPVSVDQVPRGLACNCTCRGCGTPLIAKQGEVRSWSFAHKANADCSGAAETALHKAAKQVLLEAHALMVPAITLHRSVRLDDGRSGSGSATREHGMLDYHASEDEKPHGNVRPDITLLTEFGEVFIELVVTNAVDREKHGKLLNIGIPTLEITLQLPSYLGQGEAWPTLRATILDDLINKKWLIDLEKTRLSEEATVAAILNAQHDIKTTVPHVSKKASQLQPVIRNFFSFGHTTVFLHLKSFGVVATTQTKDFAIDPLVSGWLRRWGGKFSSRYETWVFPTDKVTALRTALATLEARIAQETPYQRHQRVLEEYNRQQESN